MQNSFLAEACKQGLWIGGCLWARRDEESLRTGCRGFLPTFHPYLCLPLNHGDHGDYGVMGLGMCCSQGLLEVSMAYLTCC